jgi:hypothetical protein
MSSKTRVHFPEAVYHVISRGPEEKIPNNQSLIITYRFSRAPSALGRLLMDLAKERRSLR